jgi:uncharacterized protein (TIGR02246 family)
VPGAVGTGDNNAETKGTIMIEDDKAVRDLLQATVTAWTANDADAFAALYTKDATVTLADGTYLRNRDEIRAFMAAGFAGRLQGSRGMDQVESVRPLGAGAAVAVSRSGFTLPGESTPPPERARRATWVLARQDGDWQVAGYANCPVN